MMERKSEKTSWWQKIVLLTVSLLLCLGLCELIVRSLKLGPPVLQQVGFIRFVDNLKMVYELAPGAYTYKVNDVTYTTVINKQGFNDTVFTIAKQNKLIRIAMLGDSIAQGVYVSGNSTFSDKLEELLNQEAKKRRSSLKYEVMNFGVVGYNLTAEVEVLKEKVLVYKPDIVILNMFYNDNEPIPGAVFLLNENYLRLTEQQQLFIARKYMSGRNSWIKRFARGILYQSRLYLFLVGELDRMKAGRLQEQINKNMDDNYAKDMTIINRGFQEIDKLKREHGFRFLICIHPSLLFGEHFNNTQFAYLANSFHFDCFRMFPYYQKEVIFPELLQVKAPAGDKIHPNELGHELIAKAMFVELMQRHFIEF